MAKYYEYRKNNYRCTCGWKGLGDKCEKGETFQDLFEILCPKCHEKIDLVEFPLISEMEGSDNTADRMTAALVSAFRARFEASKLKSPDELPEIDENFIVLMWDTDGEATNASNVLIKHRDRVIWREVETYEGYRRFIEVGKILEKKYGMRLKDFIFSEKSELNLGGDHLGAFAQMSCYRQVLYGREEWIARSKGRDKICRTIEFVSDVHNTPLRKGIKVGQLRKGTNVPYLIHLMGTGKILADHGCSEDLIIAGILHDTIEDAGIRLEEIKKKFGDTVAKIVEGCSEPDKSDTWENRKKHTMSYLKTAPVDVLIVSCADKLDNIRSMRKDLTRLGDSLWARFNRPKKDQKWYYQSLSEVFLSRQEGEPFQSIAKELASEVEKVFGRNS